MRSRQFFEERVLRVRDTHSWRGQSVIAPDPAVLPPRQYPRAGRFDRVVLSGPLATLY